jgi:hypothetical protein
LALITFFTLPALAQFTRDNAASKKIDEAINEHYLATDFDKAEAVLTGTINACGDKCSPGVIAKAWMYVGIVRGSGKNDQSGAKDAFQKALAADPSVKLDTQLATPETQTTFGNLGGAGAPVPAEKPSAKPAAAAANEDANDKGGLKCTPDVREVQSRRPIPMQCMSDEEAASMEIHYKPFGGDAWKTVKMKKKDDAFRGEIPCDATGASGTLKVYVRAKDASGESVDSFGSKSKPVEFQISETTAAEPPAYEGEAPPARCVEKGECPPDFPGCQDKPKRGTKDWGVACDNSMECKEGLLCNDGTCEAAPACETNADCQTGSCVDNKCSVGSDDGGGGGGGGAKFKKNWLGLHFAQDLAFVGGTDVCSKASQANNGYACYDTGSTTSAYNGDPFPGANINGGTVVATRRILVSFDRAIGRNLTLGLRAGFAFSGGPPAGKNDTSAGTAFLPAHVEARLAYWFGQSPLGKKGLRPYVHVGGGLAQVDAKVKVPVNDCSSGALGTDDGKTENPEYDCSQGKTNSSLKIPSGATYNPADPAQVPTRELDAWKKLGQGFITAGGGVMYAFKENFGAQLNVNLMVMLPSSGFVIEPSLGVVYGF